MSTDPDAAPATEPEVQPSSTPDGPQTIPVPAEPDPAPQRGHESSAPPFDNREANPNSGGPEGLSGDMGISSERTGPLGDDPRGGGIEGTGTRGTALTKTDGEADTRPTDWDAVDVSGGDLADHESDATRETAVTDDTGTWQGIDRTVGEPKPDGIADEKVRRG